jgi:hypothetical protein
VVRSNVSHHQPLESKVYDQSIEVRRLNASESNLLDISGLYLNDPEDALVFRMDEKPAFSVRFEHSGFERRSPVLIAAHHRGPQRRRGEGRSVDALGSDPAMRPSFGQRTDRAPLLESRSGTRAALGVLTVQTDKAFW